MHLEKINIKNFRVLKDIEISFQTPSDVEKNNVVNVIAGVNGCGKTSLLDAIFEVISEPVKMRVNPDRYNSLTLSDIGLIDDPQKSRIFGGMIGDWDKKNSNRHSPYDDPRIIYLPSQQSFNYSAISQLIVRYVFSQKIDTAAILGKAEAYIKEYIINHERGSRVSDPKIRTKNAVDSFNAYFLDAKLLTQLVNLSEQFNRPIFNNAAGEKVTIDQLSDGEKQLYARVIALMMLEPRNSIILIDEPEIALHPAWQQKIMQIYSHIGENNQFIVATHSAQVISSVPYKNLILLNKTDEGKIQPFHRGKLPSGLDVNSILCDIMGAEFVPHEIVTLHNKYRLFVEMGEEKTEQAKKIKDEILAQENERSAFMQEMEFLIELRDSE